MNFRVIFSIVLLLLNFGISPKSVASVVPLYKSWVFESNVRQTLSFEIQNEYVREINFKIEDYSGITVSSGVVEVNDGVLALDFTLAKGYYLLKFPSLNEEFGFFVGSDYLDKPLDKFFGIDAPLSMILKDDQKIFHYVTLMKAFGFSSIRERLVWRHIINNGVWDVDAASRYDKIYRHYVSEGMDILCLIQAPPLSYSPKGMYPATERSRKDLRAIIGRWGELFSAIEVANEPNLSPAVRGGGKSYASLGLPEFSKSYLAYLKGSRDVLNESGGETILIGGAFSGDVARNEDFLNEINTMGFAGENPFLSFHTYAPATAMPGLVESYKLWYKNVGSPSPELWITESGWPNGGGHHDLNSAVAAKEVAAKALIAYALGVKRYYLFTFSEFRDENGVFGMVDDNGFPLKSFAAYLNVAKIITGANSVSLIKGGTGLLGVIIKKEREKYFAVYSPDARGGYFSPKFRFNRVIGADGREFSASTKNIPLADGLIFFHLMDESDLSGLSQGQF